MTAARATKDRISALIINALFIIHLHVTLHNYFLESAFSKISRIGPYSFGEKTTKLIEGRTHPIPIDLMSAGHS
jgi:hypothetical protein